MNQKLTEVLNDFTDIMNTYASLLLGRRGKQAEFYPLGKTGAFEKILLHGGFPR